MVTKLEKTILLIAFITSFLNIGKGVVIMAIITYQQMFESPTNSYEDMMISWGYTTTIQGLIIFFFSLVATFKLYEIASKSIK
jgi:hypothetical protein